MAACQTPSLDPGCEGVLLRRIVAHSTIKFTIFTSMIQTHRCVQGLQRCRVRLQNLKLGTVGMEVNVLPRPNPKPGVEGAGAGGGGAAGVAFWDCLISAELSSRPNRRKATRSS